MNETEQVMQLQTATYHMPRVSPGQQVLWYKRGFADKGSVEVAYMIHCGERTATIVSATGKRADAVRHIQDPKLKLSPEQRENGAWDFTEDYRELERFKVEVRVRLERLERHLGMGEAPEVIMEDGEVVVAKAAKERSIRGNAGADRLAQHRALVKKAREMGVMIPAQASRAEIEEAIAQALARDGADVPSDMDVDEELEEEFEDDPEDE